jgi:hypothetical protein
MPDLVPAEFELAPERVAVPLLRSLGVVAASLLS